MRKPRWRAARRQKLKAQGITPSNKQDIWCITTASTVLLPAWLKSRVVPGLAALPDRFWLHPADGMALAQFFSSIHCRYNILKTEFKRCDVCGRPMVGREATARRKIVESSPKGRETRCSATCERDRDSELWKILRDVA